MIANHGSLPTSLSVSPRHRGAGAPAAPARRTGGPPSRLTLPLVGAEHLHRPLRVRGVDQTIQVDRRADVAMLQVVAQLVLDRGTIDLAIGVQALQLHLLVSRRLLERTVARE